MKKLFVNLIFILSAFVANAQFPAAVPPPLNKDLIRVGKLFWLNTTDTTDYSASAYPGAIMYRSPDKSLYVSDSTKWVKVASGGDLSEYMKYADTASISFRIDQKLAKSDTSSLSLRIDEKVNISDTADMLEDYLRAAAAAGLYKPLSWLPAVSDVTGLQDSLSARYTKEQTDALFLQGNQTITLSGDVLGSGTTSIPTTLKNTGTAGTYTKVTTDAQGRVSSGTTLSAGDIPNLSASYIPVGQKGTANGVASLGSDGKVPSAQLPTTGSLYQGTWNASTNTPTISDGTGTAGWYYRVSTGGTQDLGSGDITFNAGDDVIYNGSIWQRVPSASAVTSVNGQMGDVVLDKDDIGLGNVDNTSDLAKPISTATQTALNGKEPTIAPGTTAQVWIGNKTWATTSTLVRPLFSAGTGLTYNSSTGAFSTNFGTTAGTVMQGNDSRVTSAVPNTRTVNAGAGLTGGGALSANISLSVDPAYASFTNYYTKTNLQTSGQAAVHWGNVTNVPASFPPDGGSGNYIQNQTATAQAGSGFWTAGIGWASDGLILRKNGSNSLITGIGLQNGSGNRFASFQLNGDANPGLALWIHNGTTGVKRQEYFADGIAQFYGSVFANGGQLRLNNTTSNWVLMDAFGVGAPTFTTRSAGMKIVLWPSLNATNTDYGIGVEASHVNFTTPQNNATYGFKWYGGTTEVARLSGTGQLNIASTLTVGSDVTISGTLDVNTINPLGTAATNFLTHNGGVIQARTAAQVRSDIGAQAAGTYVNLQAATPGSAQTGHINISGTLTASAVTSPSGNDISLTAPSGHSILFNPGGTNKGTFDSDGRFGIGTTPSAIRASLLEVAGNVWSTDAYLLGTGSVPVAEFFLSGSDAGLRTMSTQNFVFNTNASTERMRINGSSGNILINTTSDNGVNKLQVNGSISSTGQLVNGFLTALGDVSLGNEQVSINTLGQITTNGTIEAGGSITTSADFNAVGAVNAGGKVSGQHFKGGATPSVTKGALVTGSASVSGNDVAGTVTLTVTTGTSLSTNSEFFTLNFGVAYTSAPRVVFSPASATTATLLCYVKNAGTGSFQIATAPSFSTAVTTYVWNYHVIE